MMLQIPRPLRPAAHAARSILRLIRRAAWLLIVAVLLRYSTLPLGESWAQVGLLVGSDHFDYIGWTVDALAAKAAQTMWGAHPFMSEAERSDFALRYFADLARAQSLDGEIEAVYADPALLDPDTASTPLRAERDALRADLAARQTLAEAIIEGQVAKLLVEEGYGIAGQLVPPIAMRFSAAPNLLVISPRDKIQIDLGINLYPLTVDERAALEAHIDAQENVSSLIVPIGGIALYPALILETSDLRWAVETFAHEWFHHYLFMYPLGWSLDFASESRLINESAANLFGREIAGRVLARYYPELVAEEEREQTTETRRTQRRTRGAFSSLSSTVPIKSHSNLTRFPLSSMERGSGREVDSPFNFAAEMNETRVTVDALLAEGRIDDAEAYMAERQALFFANGYRIRKLNQAYFAFYGGYQVGGVPGVAGEDPIGPALRDIRAVSPTLHDFTTAIRGITTREELLALRDRMVDQ